jgi:hypothetical protein
MLKCADGDAVKSCCHLRRTFCSKPPLIRCDTNPKPPQVRIRKRYVATVAKYLLHNNQTTQILAENCRPGGGVLCLRRRLSLGALDVRRQQDAKKKYKKNTQSQEARTNKIHETRKRNLKSLVRPMVRTTFSTKYARRPPRIRVLPCDNSEGIQVFTQSNIT